MKTSEVPLTERELKFIIDLMWGAPLSIVKAAASRHGVDDADLEGHFVKCLGYLACQTD